MYTGTALHEGNNPRLALHPHFYVPKIILVKTVCLLQPSNEILIQQKYIII